MNFTKILPLMAFATLLTVNCAFAMDNTSASEAVAIATQEVPATAGMLGIEEKDNIYEAKFNNYSTFMRYTVYVDAKNGKLLRKVITGSNIVGSVNVVKTEADIKNIVLQEYPDIQDLKIVTATEGNNTVYIATGFNAKYAQMELKLNPITGAIGYQDLQYK